MADKRVAYVKGIAAGLVFLAAGVFVSWAAASDDSPVSWIAPYAFLAAVFWWIVIVLGVAAAASVSGRLSAGVVTGVLAVPAYVLSIAAARPWTAWRGVFGQSDYWIIAAITVIVPTMIGLGFGWSVLRHRPGGDGSV